MRLLISCMLFGVLALGGSAWARDINLRKHSADEVKSVCAKAGGKFSQDAQGYGCGTNCRGAPGTDCMVSCKNGESCFAQVIGARRPTSVLSALQAPAGAPH
ncbi:MAG TPA: hypothetical protein VG986_19035 [Pseudolabrys sp.]|nr:hypothetical protein [Pseudolabrys sp.]